MKFEDALGKKVIIYTKKDFRYEGELIDCNREDSFVEINDEKKKRSKNIKIDEIAEWDVC